MEGQLPETEDCGGWLYVGRGQRHTDNIFCILPSKKVFIIYTCKMLYKMCCKSQCRGCKVNCYWSLGKASLVRPERIDCQMQPDVKDDNMKRIFQELMSCRVSLGLTPLQPSTHSLLTDGCHQHL